MSKDDLIFLVLMVNSDQFGVTCSYSSWPLFMCSCPSNLASFPGLPRFFVLRFVFSIVFALFHFCVLYWTQTEEQKRRRPGNEATSNHYIHVPACNVHMVHDQLLKKSTNEKQSCNIKHRVPQVIIMNNCQNGYCIFWLSAYAMQIYINATATAYEVNVFQLLPTTTTTHVLLWLLG